MKVLCLGLDSSIFEKNSHLQKRFLEYGKITERYTVIVPGAVSRKFILGGGVVLIGVQRAAKPIMFFRLFLLGHRALKENTYDIITVRDPYFLGFIGVILSKIHRVGMEVQVHGFERFFGVRKLLARFVLGRAGSIRTVSKRLSKELQREFAIQEERITVVPIYVNCDYFRSKNTDGKEGRNFAFLSISRLASIKRIDLQLSALSLLLKIHPHTELFVVGDGPEKKNLLKKVRLLGIEKNVHFCGHEKDVSLYFKKSDCLLLTSDREGYGLIVVEAVCFGLPVIMTRVGCAQEVVIHNENGIVISPGNVKELFIAMKEIVENESLRKKLRSNSKHKKLPSLSDTLSLYEQSWKQAYLNK